MRLLKILLTSLKWCIAGEEMAALQRYRQSMLVAQKWFREFDDATDALNFVDAAAENYQGRQPMHPSIWTAGMRARRVRLLQDATTFRTRA
jgi:hypothetical protein